MPPKVDKLAIKNDKLDRRRKLTDSQRIEIKANREGLSQRKLASKYGVSRRTIQFILDPEKRAENLKRREERAGTKQYYDKDKHRESMKDHRRYKKELLEKGLLNVKDAENQ
jgi:transposase